MSAYHRPHTLDAALALLSERPELELLAGGTDIYPARAAARSWGRHRAGDILDISAIPDLRGIEDRGDHWWIGALTTWTDLVRAPLPPLFDGLKQAAQEIGGRQIQNRGTIVGNCCTASPAGDGIPCLLALDAEFEITGSRPRTVPSAQFFVGYRQTLAGAGDLVTGLRIPHRPGRSRFRKLGARRYLVISIAMVAATVDTDRQGLVRSAQIAVGACASTAQRLLHLEAALIGQVLDPALVAVEHFAQLAPIDDIRATAAFRRHAAMQLTRDTIADLAKLDTIEEPHGRP